MAAPKERTVQEVPSEEGANTRLIEWTNFSKKKLEFGMKLLSSLGKKDSAVRTLSAKSMILETSRIGLCYEPLDSLVTLREYIQQSPAPPPEERLAIARSVTKSVRDLVHKSDLSHPGLRLSSFAFQTTCDKISPQAPYVLDWLREPVKDLHHLEKQEGQAGWLSHSWALLMILSEIAGWEVLEETAYATYDTLASAQTERVVQVSSPDWKGKRAAVILKNGFAHHKRLQSSPDGDKRFVSAAFFDDLLKVLE